MTDIELAALVEQHTGLTDKHSPAYAQAYRLAHAVATAAAEAAGSWIESDSSDEPAPAEMVLLAVHYENHREDDDGNIVVTEGCAIDFGHRVNHEHGWYFTAYASPHGDNEHISHWMPLPALPETWKELPSPAEDGQ